MSDYTSMDEIYSSMKNRPSPEYVLVFIGEKYYVIPSDLMVIDFNTNIYEKAKRYYLNEEIEKVVYDWWMQILAEWEAAWHRYKDDDGSVSK